MVTLTHPNLPGQSIEVDQRAVRHYERSGWRVLVDAAPEGEPATQPDEDESANPPAGGESAETGQATAEPEPDRKDR